MKVIVCHDLLNGIMFNKRRTCHDINQRKHLRELINGSNIYMSDYSYKKFSDIFPDAKITDSVTDIKENEYFFLENDLFDLNCELVNEFIVYKWDNSFPSDFDFNYIEENKEKFDVIDLGEILDSQGDKIFVSKYLKK